MRQTATTCPFCGVGCGLVLAVADGRVTDVRPLGRHPVSRGQLCAKGWNAEKFLADPERLTTPLVRRGARLEPVSWDVALAAAAEALAVARGEGGADAVGVIASARATNEDNFAAMKFARSVLGTNNLDHCARVCHSPSVEGLRRTLGSGAMTNSIADLERAGCLPVVDGTRDGGGERTRQWDSCLLEGFQREASGHHPSPRPGDRVRRFWYHKLSDDFVADSGKVGCVGCGRCDVTCPGSIGALRVLGALGSR